MTSANIKIDKRRLSYTRLIGEIHHALNQALTEEHAAHGLTRAKMAEILGIDRATITKLLSGTRNMRLETLADLAYALNRPVRILLPSRTVASNQYAPPPQPSPVPAEPKPINIAPPPSPVPTAPVGGAA